MADTPPQPRHEAKAIRARRLELGWTQHRLAHESGISIATIRKLESDKQPYYRALTLVPLCVALGWTPDALNSLLPPDGADDLTAPDDPQPERLAAFDGDLSGLSQDDLDEVAELVHELRQRRQR
jgi:transcriptional regulator with XRE-family HTH domain